MGYKTEGERGSEGIVGAEETRRSLSPDQAARVRAEKSEAEADKPGFLSPRSAATREFLRGLFGGDTSPRCGMLDRRALRAALCVLSCAWLHAGAASRLKSPALPIQSEREPLPSKGLSGEKLICRVVHVCVRGDDDQILFGKSERNFAHPQIFTLFLGISSGKHLQ